MKKYCGWLHRSLSFYPEAALFCCYTGKIPGVYYDGGELPVEKIKQVRNALIEGLDGDMNKPIEDCIIYDPMAQTRAERLGGPAKSHPCKGCPCIERRHAVSSPPAHLSLNYLAFNSFFYCNSKCDYCVRYDTKPGDGYSIARVVDQLFKAGSIRPTCRVHFAGGEPTLNKEYMQVLSDLTGRGYAVGVHTNAIRFAPEIEKALAAGDAYIRVSLDSGDRDSFRAMKGVDKFDAVSNNIARYAAAARGRSQFLLKYIVYDKNNSRETLDRFVSFCKNHGVTHTIVAPNFFDGLGRHVSNATIKALAYLVRQLEQAGLNVTKQAFHYLTASEQQAVSEEYARLFTEGMNVAPGLRDELTTRLAQGFTLSKEAALLRAYWTEFLKSIVKSSKGFALYGAGAHTQWLRGIMTDLEIRPAVIFDDNAKQFDGMTVPIAKPSEVANYPIDTVIVSTDTSHYEIYSKILMDPAFKHVRLVDPYLSLPNAPYSKE